MVENGAQIHPKQHKEDSLNGGLPSVYICIMLTCKITSFFLNFPLNFHSNQVHTLRMPNKDNLFMTPHVNKMHKELEDDNVGPTSK